MKLEMIKLNRIKYAYSEEEKKQLLKDGYVMTSGEKSEKHAETQEEKTAEDLDNIQQPESQTDTAEKKTTEKKETKKK